MSDTIKITSLKKFSIKGGLSEGGSQEDKAEHLQQQLRFQYEAGYDQGYSSAQKELEQQYTQKLLDKYDEILSLFYDFNERADEYDKTFEKLIIEFSFVIAEQIIKKEVERNTVIAENIRFALRKILGANQIIVKLNPSDLSRINEDSNQLFAETGLSKIRFEAADNVEAGGCLIETDIGSVDARLSTQLMELRKNLINTVFAYGNDN